MARLPYHARMALNRKQAVRGTRAPRVASIVGWFSPPPWLAAVVRSVAQDACHLVREALQRLLAVTREDAQNGHRRATIPNGPAAVEPVGTWPKSVVPALPPHDGRSGSPARSKPYSAVPRSPSPARHG